MEPTDQPRAYARLLTDEEATRIPPTPPDRASLICSFCGKSREQVSALVAGRGISDPATGAIIAPVYICNECIAVCAQVLAEETPGSPPEPHL